MFLGVLFPYASHLNKWGYFEGICDQSRDITTNENTMQYWMYSFNMSKFAELFDTLFLVLKHPERPVPFLHWYHHVTVLLFVWYADYWKYPGMIFIIVNACIHMFMYFYYFLKEMRIPVSEKYYALPLTMGQISQMFVGIFVNGSWAFMHYIVGRNCSGNNPEAIAIACAIMYGSYLYLFVSFFYHRYIATGNKRERPTTDKKKQ